MTLFLASCGVHHHRYDAAEDTYYQDDYYAYGEYDTYDDTYSYGGDGVYYNNYNYYPDRWGMNYSDVHYSPYRYPRVGFYFSSSNTCGYSYWSNWCTPGIWPHYGYGYYANSWWPSYVFGFSTAYHYNNLWWYNHWRHRNYQHNRPSRHGYNSARNEVRRLSHNRYGYKQHSQYRNSSRPANRSRDTGLRYRNDGYRSRPSLSTPNRSRSAQPVQNRPTQRQRSSVRQEAARIGHGSTNSTSASRSITPYQQQRTYVPQPSRTRAAAQPNQDSATRGIQHSTQQPAQRPTYQVRPMDSQTPIYHRNRVINQSNSAANRPQVNNRVQQPVHNNRSTTRTNNTRPRVSTPKPVQRSSQPPRSKPARVSRSRSVDKDK